MDSRSTFSIIHALPATRPSPVVERSETSYLEDLTEPGSIGSNDASHRLTRDLTSFHPAKIPDLVIQ